MTTTQVSRVKSQELFEKAKTLLPGGVNSPVRAFGSIDGQPIFIKKAEGAYTFDEDGNKYIDYVGSWGPMILGHRNKKIEDALKLAIENGTSFGAPTAIENEMAEEVIKLVDSVEVVRFVNSGTEAVMSAIRLARAFSSQANPNKVKIVKFTGCYHGHVDPLLVQAGSGVATLGLPDSPGVTKQATENTILIPLNDPKALEQAFAAAGEDIAAVILEPITGNCGMIYPQDGFIEKIRELCDQNKALLIFDEVMTGFRVALGGAQEKLGIKPDLTCLGKVIGGGLPVGAYGGRKDIMAMVAPSGPVYQAGTLSGNPLAMTAGLTCLRELKRPGLFAELEEKAKLLIEGMQKICEQKNIPAQFTAVGGMFGFYLMKADCKDKEIKSFEDAKEFLDLELYKKMYLSMLEQGVYFAPSAFEAGFISIDHSQEDIEKTLAAFEKSL